MSQFEDCIRRLTGFPSLDGFFPSLDGFFPSLAKFFPSLDGLSEVSIKSGHGKLRVAMIEITILKDVYRMTKKITQEYRDYVVKLVVEENRKVTELSYELGIGESSIHRWVKKYRDGKKQENGDVKYVTPSELKKLEATYEKKLRDLEEENAILKKAMHIFAKNPQ